MIRELADALGRLCGSPLTVTETRRLRERALEQARRSEPNLKEIIDTCLRMRKEAGRIATFPDAAQPAAWRQLEEALWREAEHKPPTFLSESLRRAANLGRVPIVSGEVPLTRNAAQAYFEMRDFFQDLAAPRPSRPTTTEVLKGGDEIAQLFAAAEAEERRFIAAADRTWYVVRANWELASADLVANVKRQATEAMARTSAKDLGGRFTPATLGTLLRAGDLLARRPDTYWSARHFGSVEKAP
jgi:hypothetical protein